MENKLFVNTIFSLFLDFQLQFIYYLQLVRFFFFLENFPQNFGDKVKRVFL